MCGKPGDTYGPLNPARPCDLSERSIRTSFRQVLYSAAHTKNIRTPNKYPQDLDFMPERTYSGLITHSGAYLCRLRINKHRRLGIV
jgi:hypothetical protein